MGKKKHQPPKKPTGTTGAVTFGGGEPPTFTSVKFPHAKREIEQLIMEAAFRASRVTGVSLRTLYQLTAEPRLNPGENNWDILLPTAQGEQHLDLMEAAPLNTLGRSYDKLPHSFVQGDRADAIFAEILHKSDEYGVSPRSVIHLMIYSTDFRLHLPSGVLDLLAIRALRRRHVFASIVYLGMYDESDYELKLVYPRPAEEFAGFNKEQVRGQQIGVADLTKTEGIPNGFKAKLGPVSPPGPGPVTLHIRHRAVPPSAP